MLNRGQLVMPNKTVQSFPRMLDHEVSFIEDTVYITISEFSNYCYKLQEGRNFTVPPLSNFYCILLASAHGVSPNPKLHFWLRFDQLISLIVQLFFYCRVSLSNYLSVTTCTQPASQKNRQLKMQRLT
jgi:hypothetical protein